MYKSPVSVAVSLDPGNWADRNADWWIAANIPFGWYSYVYPTTGWTTGIKLCVRTGLFDLSPPFEVLNMKLPAVGNYTFYFAVDGNADGIPDTTWLNSVKMKVE